ncbi:MAG TPA: GTPase HflX, partial [Chromatiaceae bacterium]|nr:GTPase HflX [Chromatiaceae bacterium]
MAKARQAALLLMPKSAADELDEVVALARTAGDDITGVVWLRNPLKIGEGKVCEIKERAAELGAESLIAYYQLKPLHYFKLYREVGVKEILDKVTLILQIFSLHAGSKEAQIQIELARTRHLLPIIREWIRQTKLGELPGFLGPGRYAVDKYYTMLRRREHKLKEELERLRARRQRERAKRRELGLPHVAIVGYTCAGKTTLFNALTNESRPVSEEYFTTLHPKAKAVDMNGLRVAFIDTVGFIKGVPPTIIEAFYATLEEMAYSDLVLLVVDISEPAGVITRKLREAITVLERVGAMGIPLICAANKVDKLSGGDVNGRVELLHRVLAERHPYYIGVVPVSALTGRNLTELRERV